jgi:DNA recombination-dependent growth factor C
MNELKEEVVLDLIKKSLPQLTGFSAYYHTDSKSLIIDTAKEDFAKLAISTLCHTLKAIETTTLHVSGVSNSLSQNILDCINTNKELGFAGFEYANKLHLANPDGETVKFQCEYTLDHVKELLESGYTVKRVGISRDSMSFDLTDDFKIKSIKSNIEQQETETKEEAEINEQEAQLTIMAGNLLELVTFFNKAS